MTKSNIKKRLRELKEELAFTNGVILLHKEGIEYLLKERIINRVIILIITLFLIISVVMFFKGIGG